MRRGCLRCWAYFDKDTDEETIKAIKNHQEDCTREEPYRDDPNADGYDDF